MKLYKPYNPWSFNSPVAPGALFSAPTPLRVLLLVTPFCFAGSYLFFFDSTAPLPLAGVVLLILGILAPIPAHWHWKKVEAYWQKEQEATDA